MSLMALIWVAMAVTFTVLSLRRPVWAVALYLQTFFAAPHMWWWGRDLPEMRYASIAGYLLLLAVVISPRATVASQAGAGAFRLTAVAMLANATFVHFLLAVDQAVSTDTYVETLKFTLLFFLLNSATKDRRDFLTLSTAMSLGAAYIGWEVTINERGDFNGSRLEGVGAPGADTANGLANLLLTVLPIAGSLFLQTPLTWKLVSVVASPLILNVLILCNSRGAFLGLVGTGVAFLFIARGQLRTKAIRVLALAGVALFLLLGDPEILERFTTTFAGSEERDASASSRLEFWQAGLRLLGDRPLGGGGGVYKYVLGERYLAEIVGADNAEARSLHNGYLTEATDWGVQGLLLKLGLFFFSMRAAYRTCERCRKEGRTQDALVGLCALTGAVGFLISTMFGSFLNAEWGFWILALMSRYADLYREADTSSAADSISREAEPSPAAA